MADIIFGNVSPSGRLPVTFYESCDDLPAFSDYSMGNRTYKFYKGNPVYPFGHGLNYSDIDEKWLDPDTVVLENKGDVSTDYTVLQFVQHPNKELVGFRKVNLEAGDIMTVTFK